MSLTTFLEVLGLVLVAVGAALVFPPAGVVVAGGEFLFVAWMRGGDE